MSPMDNFNKLQANNFNEVVEEILANISPFWSELEKARYIYLCLGKALNKHTDFFLSFDGKLKEQNLSTEELAKIYNDSPEKSEEWNLVICKSAAKALQYCLKLVGIESKLVCGYGDKESYDKNLTINHWFLSINADGKNYFATLTADLANIKNNFPTEHFGVPISHTKKESNEPVYMGEKITETVLSKEELRKLDEQLGYINTVFKPRNKTKIKQKEVYEKDKEYLVYDNLFLDMISTNSKNNTWFYNLEIKKTDFYQFVVPDEPINLKECSDDYFIELGKQIEMFTDTREEKICKQILEKYKKKFPNITTKDLKDCIFLKKVWDYQEKHYNSTKKTLPTEELKKIKGFETIESLNIDIFKLNFFNEVKNDYLFQHLRNFINEKDSLINKLVNITNGNNKNIIISKLQFFIDRLSFYFINNQHIIKHHYTKNITNEYIAAKLSTMFQEIFSCNEITLPFNKQHYSEQKEVIAEVVKKIFENDSISEDLGRKLCSNENNYRPSEVPILNIIRFYCIRDLKNDTYDCIFHIPDKKNQTEIFFKYETKTNKFTSLRPTEITILSNNYLIVSNTLYNTIQEIENIEDKEKSI